MDNVFLYANYVSLFISRFSMFCEPVLFTVAVFLLYRAIRSRAALVMIVAQLIDAAQGFFFDIQTLLGKPYIGISHPTIMLFVNFIFIAANITLYIALILVATEVGRKLRPEKVEGSPIRPFSVS